jgi:hypothetical protein
MLPTVTIDQIRNFDPPPCYDPGRYLPEGWTGTALDVLAVEECPAEDRLWVVLHEEFIDARTMRLFAVWCARQALALVDNPDPRSVAACDVAERYANGEATDSELVAARTAAWAAAKAAVWASNRITAVDVAMSAVWASTAKPAAWDVADAAARDAAWAAEHDHTLDRAWDDVAATRESAMDAAWVMQLDHLREMLS